MYDKTIRIVAICITVCVVLAFLATGGCQKSHTIDGDATVLKEGKLTEENHARLVKAQPPPMFDYSLERENLIKKLKLMNTQNRIFYIYCLGMNGNVVYHGMVKGKVSSLNSLLTTPEQLIYVGGQDSTRNGVHRMPSPDFDGSYGKNPDGIFWFSPDDRYHEWAGGPYYLSETPEKINTPISITTTVDLEKKGK
jgi:hypothetical protein